jgi:hypothetical protein
MKETIYILTAHNFGTMFVHPLSTLKTNKMRTSNLITTALIITALTALVGVTQAQTWEQFGMFTFAISVSMFMLGLIATEK